jgi:hypothetical protein
VGAAAEKLREKEHEFRSAEKEVTRLVDGVPTTVTVNYPVIDEGKTRFQENEDRKARNLERELTMQQIASNDAKLQALYSESFHALKSVPGERPWTEEDRFEHVREAWQWFARTQADDADPLTAVVGEHLSARAKDQIKRDNVVRGRDDFFDWPMKTGGNDPGDRASRREPSDAFAGAGLALIGRISDALESFLDGPTGPGDDGQERDMPDKKTSREPTNHQRVEQQQRGQEAELAAQRKQMLEAYLDQRDKERYIDRGR